MKFSQLRITARGFTLLEAMVVVTILGILLAVAVPSISDWIIIQRVKASATELVLDINFSRGESIKRNMRTAVTFKSAVNVQYCYTVHTKYTGMTCNCLQGARSSCDQALGEDAFSNFAEELKTVSLPSSTKIEMTAQRGQVAFLPPSGLMEGQTPMYVNFDGLNSRKLKVLVNALGRPQLCTPAGSRITGYPICP